MKSYNDQSNLWIKTKQSSNHLSHIYLEKPAIYSQLQSNYQNILILGCGSGEEIEYFLRLGVKRIVAIDISSNLIEYAKQTYLPFWLEKYQDIEIQFICGDLNNFDFEIFGDGQFDLVFSSLTMHYIFDWIKILEQIKRVLRKDSKFLFSTHHPVKWGAKSDRQKEANTFTLGYKKSKTKSKNEINYDYQIFGDYLNFRKIEDKLFDKLDVTYYHRSIGQIFEEIKKVGMVMTNLIEPKPTIESKSIKLDFFETYSKIPLFLIIECQKQD
jgi:SAM-dependent methyltransferase